MLERIAAVKDERPRVLNLFAYTGAASLGGRHGCGGDACRCLEKSHRLGTREPGGLEAGRRADPWILDDAAKFVAREVRRGKTYHVILVDPPKFGRGPAGEVWDLFTSLAPMLNDCAKLLAPAQSAMVLTVYAIRASALAFDQLCRETLATRGGSFHSGELAIRAEDGNAVPTSLFTRWTASP